MPEEKTDKQLEEASEAKTNEIEQQEKIESNAAERLDAVFNEHASTPESELKEEPDSTSDEEPDEEPEADPQKDDSEPASESKSESDSTDKDEPDSDDTAGDDDVKLTQAEIRAAIHNGWKVDDVNELAKENPGLAKRTCAKMLESTNSLSKQFAELGRTSKKEEKPEEKPEVKKTEFKPVDIGQLKDKYGEDEPIVGLFEQQQKMLETVVAKLDSVEAAASSASATRVDTAQARADKAADEATAQQIESFFNDPEIVVYGEFYGKTIKADKDWSNLTIAQMTNRQNLVEEAGNILSGAEQRGLTLTLSEAFDKAHLMATAGVREQVIRDEIKSKSKKRAKSITLKPSSSSRPSNSGGLSTKDVESNASARLAKVFK